MVCYTCGGETQVINSRHQRRNNQVWRRRKCILCDTVVTTLEGIDYSKALVVRRPESRHPEPLLRDRLFMSLYKSLAHRPTAIADAGDLCTTIIAKLARVAQNGELSTTAIVQTTGVALTRFDLLAAQHYQALHKH